jgi:lysophospholipase L1-like esterase
MRRLVPAAAGLLIMLSVPVAPAHAEPPAPTDAGPPVYLLIDTSESMSDYSAGTDLRRIDAAQSAALSVVGNLDPSQRFGLYQFPGFSKVVNGCAGADQVTPLSTTNRSEASVDVRQLAPFGNTPTGPALSRLLETIKADGVGRAMVVLVSDGEENCGESSCAVAQRYAEAGIDLVINTVGLENSEAGNEQLRCVARAAGGRFFTTDTEKLGQTLLDASAARIELTMRTPSAISPAVGGAPGDLVTATVTSKGGEPARDVRLYLDARWEGQAQPGAIAVARPIRWLGNLQPGVSRTIGFEVRMDPPAGRGVRPPVRLELVATVAGKPATSYQQRVPVATGLDRAANPLFESAEHVVVLGDSYSSGEGGTSYDRADDRPDLEKCHRSTYAYGRQLFPRAELLACSGAVSSHLYWGQYPQIPPQLDALRELTQGEHPPDLALLTFGGNDMGFADLVQTCVLGQCSAELDWIVGMRSRWQPALRNNLITAYRSIDRALNDPDAVRKRSGRQAHVVVLPYVRVVPAAADTVNGCFAGFSAAEVAQINRFQAYLNQTIESAVAALAATGRPVHHPKQVKSAFLPAHTMCEETESFVQYAKLDQLPGKILLGGNQELVHPNERGQRAIAQALARWQPTVISPGPAPTEDVPIDDVPANDLIVRETVASYPFNIDRLRLRPHGVAFVTVNSEPRLVTTAEQRDGRLLLRLPPGLPPGRHTVRIDALDQDGKPVTITESIYLWPPGSNLALLVAGAASVALAGYLLGMRLRRRRGPTAA